MGLAQVLGEQFAGTQQGQLWRPCSRQEAGLAQGIEVAACVR